MIKSKAFLHNEIKNETSKGVCKKEKISLLPFFSPLDRLDENSDGFCDGLFSFILLGVGLSALIKVPNVPKYLILSRKEIKFGE